MVRAETSDRHSHSVRGGAMLGHTAVVGGLIALACLSGTATAQIAAGKPKYLGNVTGNNMASGYACASP